LAIETAIEMEHLGGDFYETLASSGIDPKLASLCHKLAAAEIKHCEYFLQIRAKMAERGETVVLRDEELTEARRAARKAIFPDHAAVGRLLGESNVSALVAMAKQIEQSAIDYYTAIAASLPNSEAIHTLIRAEHAHLRMLNDYRA